jgi:O-antigen/teichoic acid export membrane protein
MSNIKHNSFFGLLGFVIPTGVVLVSYPVLIHHLGASSFGIYILATSISGTLAFLDFGISAATLKFVAEDVAKGDYKAAANVIVASLIFYGGLGVLGAIAIWVLSPWLILIFSVATSMQGDAIIVFRLASIQFAIFFITTVFISLFKGLQRFQLSTVILSLLSILTYGSAAICTLTLGFGLIGITFISLMANLIVLGLSSWMGLQLCYEAGIPIYLGRPTRVIYRRMLGFGSALAVSSIAGILHAQIQKMLIAALLGPQYVTSFVLGVWGPAKINSATRAMSEPLFPRIASISTPSKGKYIRSLYYRYVIVLIVFSSVGLLPFLFYSRKIFAFWMGAAVPAYAPEIASIIAISLLINVLGQPAYHCLNGLGRPLSNTVFALISPIVLYSVLGALYLIGKRLSVVDFAWATSASLILTSFAYLLWFEVYTLTPLHNTSTRQAMMTLKDGYQ